MDRCNVFHFGGMLKTGSRSKKHLALGVEALEARTVPAQISYNAGVITIDGSNKNDVAKVEIETNDAANPLDDRVRVSISNSSGSTTVWFDRYNALKPVAKIAFNGFGGDDQFFNMTNLPSLAHGHAGNDILVGGTGNDLIYGDGGADNMYGGGGNDTLYGDTNLPPQLHAAFINVFGYDGNDYLEGGDGVNFLYGEGGDDFLWGGDNTDWLYGGYGNDTLYGNKGVDYLFGQAGDDYISGGDDIDFLTGAEGKDNMSGGNGNDVMSGGAGNDAMAGDDGDDTIHGDAGNDSIFGHDGNDKLYGDAGADVLHGGIGNDFLYGGTENDVLYGDDGADRLEGNDGDDYLNGGTQGQSVNDGDLDLFYGGKGSDYFRFEEVGNLPALELALSDFLAGVDRKPY